MLAGEQNNNGGNNNSGNNGGNVTVATGPTWTMLLGTTHVPLLDVTKLAPAPH